MSSETITPITLVRPQNVRTFVSGKMIREKWLSDSIIYFYFIFVCIYVLYFQLFEFEEKKYFLILEFAFNLPFLLLKTNFKVFWHPYNASSEFYSCHHKIFQFQAHLEHRQVLKKVTSLVPKHLCGCPDKEGWWSLPLVKRPQLLTEWEYKEVQNGKLDLIFWACSHHSSCLQCTFILQKVLPCLGEQSKSSKLHQQLHIDCRTLSSSHFSRN